MDNLAGGCREKLKKLSSKAYILNRGSVWPVEEMECCIEQANNLSAMQDMDNTMGVHSSATCFSKADQPRPLPRPFTCK